MTHEQAASEIHYHLCKFLLKEKNVEVYFEKEDISTLDSKGEFLITLMSSLAQEESRSISENVARGIRKRFADGKFSVPYKAFLGYDRGKDGTMVINAEQEEIVQLTLVERVLVGTDDSLRFVFIDGYETLIDIPERSRVVQKTATMAEKPAPIPTQPVNPQSTPLTILEGESDMEHPKRRNVADFLRWKSGKLSH